MNASVPIRWVPWTLAVLPLLTMHLCHWINWRAAILPGCAVYWQGCVSISAAGRYPPANHLFDAVMTPMGLLLALFWLLQARWMAAAGAGRGARSSIVGAGLVAGAAMVVYAAFLGENSPEGRLLRRLGINAYFFFNSVALGVAGWWLRRLAAGQRLGRLMGWLFAAMLFTGFLSLAETLLPADINAIDNIIEWHFALFMSAQFAVLGAAWRQHGLRLELSRA